MVSVVQRSSTCSPGPIGGEPASCWPPSSTPAPARRSIVELLAPAEREVGARWERREWNVAQEHAATAVVDAALAALSFDTEVVPSAGRLLLACVEGEWHSLPARMAAELLRLRGWDTTLLGASVSAEDLGAQLRQLSPDAVGLSCSVTLSLKGAQRSIAACLAAGTPVLAGGAGFGEGGRYAARLGAHGWVPDPRCAGAVLERCLLGGPPVDPSPDEEHLRLEAARAELIAGALESVLGRHAPSPEPTTVAQAYQAFDALLASVESACLVRDSTVVATCAPIVDRLLPDELAGRVRTPELLQALVPDLREQSARAAALAKDALREARPSS